MKSSQLWDERRQVHKLDEDISSGCHGSHLQLPPGNKIRHSRNAIKIPTNKSKRKLNQPKNECLKFRQGKLISYPSLIGNLTCRDA